MKKLSIFLIFCLIFMAAGDAFSQRSRHHKRHARHRTHQVVKKRKHSRRGKARFIPVYREKVDTSGVLCEDTCGHVHGIDLSHYQGNVFWETITENTNMAYVYLKATEGGDRIDATFERNIEMAHAHGLKVGSYHFYRPRTEQVRQLENFTTQCLAQEQDLIPMIDIETTGGLSNEAFCDSLLKFLNLVEEVYQQKPLLYTFRNFYNRHLLGKLDDYQLMIAMYTPEEPVLADGRDITMWQYTGKGSITGVSGFVDKSRFMGDHCLRDIRFRH